MNKKILSAYLAASVACVCAFAQSVEKTPWGKTKSGEQVYAYTVKNENGLSFTAINYGATISKICVPDRDGNFADIALGFDSVSGYESAANPYFGALVGRYGNRIANASFKVGDKLVKVSANEKNKCLHGGAEGFNKKMWRAEEIRGRNFAGVKFAMTSPDGDQGFEGRLDVVVVYILNNQNDLSIEYYAQTDKATPVNLTQHTYFNLAGEGNGTILDTIAQINAREITPVDAALIPTGEFMNVENTPFDFATSGRKIGERIADENPQIKIGGGYDHNFVVSRFSDGKMRFIGAFIEPVSGRSMRVFSTEPGVQFYSGNFLDGKIAGKSGKPYLKRGAFAFETQHFPDSPNQKNFPSTILEPDDVYYTKTVWHFDAE